MISFDNNYNNQVTWQQRNPKRSETASHARYELYKICTTVADARAAGMRGADLHHDMTNGFVSMVVPPRRKLSAAVHATYTQAATETRDVSSSAPDSPMHIHSDHCPHTRVSASHAPPERPTEGTGLGSSSAPGSQVTILIISMDAQRANMCKNALAQSGHVESVQARA
jgi:hypothetical protein